MAPRQRRHATARQLADALTVLLQTLGLRFCTYSDESNSVDGAKLGHIGDRNIFEGCNVETVRATHRCGKHDLAVTKKTMEHALGIVAGRCQSGRTSSPLEVGDFVAGRKVMATTHTLATGCPFSRVATATAAANVTAPCRSSPNSLLHRDVKTAKASYASARCEHELHGFISMSDKLASVNMPAKQISNATMATQSW